MAPDARIVSVKVGTADGGTDVSQMIAAIDWVVQHAHDPGLNIRILNLSYGTNSTQSYVADPLAYAAEVAWKQGIVVVAAGGNNGYQRWTSAVALSDPAFDPFLLAVGASDPNGTADMADDSVPPFSPRPTHSGTRGVDLVSPGVHLQGLRVPNSYIDAVHPLAVLGERYFRGSGTSQSAAIVSGAAALILQKYPGATPDQVKRLLTSTAYHIYAKPSFIGGGELQLTSALAAALPSWTQTWTPSTGVGSLELARGSDHLTLDGVVLTGERDIMGSPFNAPAMAALEAQGASWSGGDWNGIVERRVLVGRVLERGVVERRVVERGLLVRRELVLLRLRGQLLEWGVVERRVVERRVLVGRVLVGRLLVERVLGMSSIDGPRSREVARPTSMRRAHTRARSLALGLSLVVLAATWATATAAPGAARAKIDGALLTAAERAPGSMLSIIVRERTPSSSDAEAAARELGGRTIHELTIVGGFSARLPGSALLELAGSDAVMRIWGDAPVTVNSVDMGRFDTWPANTIWQKTIRLPQVPSAYTGTGVAVALLDTGVSQVPDLGNRVVARVDFTPEHDGYDRYGHGTHMAGIIAGDGSASGGGWAGIAPGANLVSVKVAGADGSTDVSVVLAGLEWVVDHRAQYNIRVLNLSFGTDSTQPYQLDPLDYAVERVWFSGILVVVSAGNRGPGPGTLNKPGDDPFVLTVGAADLRNTIPANDDAIAVFSGSGPVGSPVKPEISAPGVTIVSSRAVGSTIDQAHPLARVGDAYFKGTGTSQAAAVVSGVAARMFQANPALTPNVAKAILMGTAKRSSGLKSAPLVDAAGAVLASLSHAFDTRPANQGLVPSAGLGSLEASRGSFHVYADLNGDGIPELVQGEVDVLGQTWDGRSWSGRSWSAESWASGTWCAYVAESPGWEARSWSGRSWSGTSWDGRSWSGQDWTGQGWSGGSLGVARGAAGRVKPTWTPRRDISRDEHLPRASASRPAAHRSLRRCSPCSPSSSGSPRSGDGPGRTSSRSRG